FAAAQLADLLWPIFVALGVEQVRIVPGLTPVTPLDFVSYPYSHSLLLLVIWAIAAGFIYRHSSRSARAAVLVGALVVSHWVLDWITHRPDMPLYPGGPKAGLGLWYSMPATLIVECSIFAAGVWLYVAGTRPVDRSGRWALIAFNAFLLVIYVSNLIAVPPS